ncbi:hypothetical protein [Pseudomonas sp. SED1]|uniref:hypothetical protein n=1 Tax=Pseudomonas sp. SED1 TaxID=3056845 RepID=UPI00296F93B6|nr:hypothetical protein [Pseudomonas sp. SED1]MDY0836141.1 hypothetical protein [Pseudomonas sp. SED1]
MTATVPGEVGRVFLSVLHFRDRQRMARLRANQQARELAMKKAKPIDPQELVKWLVALRRAINSRNI